MAQLSYRVIGKVGQERRSKTFRDSDEGRRARDAFIAELDPKSVQTKYDVRTRIRGRVVTKTFLRKNDANRYANSIESNKVRGAVVDPRDSRVTLRKFASEWLAHRPDLGERTAELYEWLLEKHILPTFGDVPLADISPSAVRVWNADLAAKHATTAAKAYRLFSSIMKVAVADERLPRNPCQVKGACSEKAPERPVITVAQVNALANAMTDHLRIAILFAVWDQLRPAEILGLRRRDINLLKKTVSVVVTRATKMSGKMVEKEPKTGAGRRTLTIPDNVIPALTAHLDNYVAPEPDARLIPVSSRTLGYWWNKARVGVGLPSLRLHDLRHTGLTLSAVTGATTAELMHRAGHRSPAAALRYQHASENRDRVLADALAELATPSRIGPSEHSETA